MKYILHENDTRPGHLKKTKFMKESLRIEYAMQRNDAI